MSIVQLTSSHHKEVVKLFGNEIENYYFIINDLISNNYKSEHFRVYGEYEREKLVSILLTDFNNISYYSNSDREVDIYQGVIESLTFNKFSGSSKLVEKFIPYLDIKDDTISHMGVVKDICAKRMYPDLEMKIIQSEEEIGMQYDLFLLTEEFKGSLPENKNTYIDMEYERLKYTSDRTVYLSIDNEMVSSVSTIREGEKSAIIIGVFTNPKFRGKGYGTEVLIALFNMLLKEGKYLYLFYTNPLARSVYKNIGMTEVCEWRLVTVK